MAVIVYSNSKLVPINTPIEDLNRPDTLANLLLQHHLAEGNISAIAFAHGGITRFFKGTDEVNLVHSRFLQEMYGQRYLCNAIVANGQPEKIEGIMKTLKDYYSWDGYEHTAELRDF